MHEYSIDCGSLQSFDSMLAVCELLIENGIREMIFKAFLLQTGLWQCASIPMNDMIVLVYFNTATRICTIDPDIGAMSVPILGGAMKSW